MKKLSVKFQVLVSADNVESFEYSLEDLLKKIILPTLGAELKPLTLSVVKSRQ